MPNKKSIKKECEKFIQKIDEIEKFSLLTKNNSNITHDQCSWIFDCAIIKLYAAFEGFILETLVAAINQDTSTISTTLNIEFSKHIKEDICRYLITGTGYFDFKGRSGLINVLRKFIPSTHFIFQTIKETTYTDSINKLVSLRNFAAHDSSKSKQLVLKELNRKRIKTSGAWLKKETNGKSNLSIIADDLKLLSSNIKSKANF